MVAIRCREITKLYKKDRVLALDRLNFELHKNVVFGFLGPNGAGKTTTIKILTGLMRPSSGTSVVAGEPVSLNSTRLRSKIGYLSQTSVFYHWMTGKELLLFVGRLFGLSRKENGKRADELLGLSGLTDSANRRIGGYSGGMIQRLGIAQAMVNKPEVLFLDEPCSSLDPLGRKEVLEFIANIGDTTTVFMSTHILSDAERVCDVVGIIHKGKMVMLDKMATIKQHVAKPILELEFSNTTEVERFKKLIESHLRIKNIIIKSRILSLASEDLGALRKRIFALMTHHDFDIIRMEIKSATLEDVFLKLTGENR